MATSERPGPGLDDRAPRRKRRPFAAAVEWLKTHVRWLARAVRKRRDAVLRDAPASTDQLIDTVTEGSASTRAVLKGAGAALTGKNPVWAAVKGLISGLSTRTKILLALLVVLVALLAPVLLVVALLALLVAWLVAAVRAATR
ncbi:hypothetical protein ICV35_01525 [Rhodococcus ruber]|uniref:hypothetical protein n=1 Tax=Rhodococcus ruber TaxID=1830 RepID=UPI0017834470|nr:hypothetical protein [Rhodococcus ruber]MBD8052344.1 hypothetical protein [Rhodococcus ruber]